MKIGAPVKGYQTDLFLWMTQKKSSYGPWSVIMVRMPERDTYSSLLLSRSYMRLPAGFDNSANDNHSK